MVASFCSISTVALAPFVSSVQEKAELSFVLSEASPMVVLGTDSNDLGSSSAQLEHPLVALSSGHRMEFHPHPLLDPPQDGQINMQCRE